MGAATDAPWKVATPQRGADHAEREAAACRCGKGIRRLMQTVISSNGAMTEEWPSSQTLCSVVIAAMASDYHGMAAWPRWSVRVRTVSSCPAGQPLFSRRRSTTKPWHVDPMPERLGETARNARAVSDALRTLTLMPWRRRCPAHLPRCDAAGGEAPTGQGTLFYRHGRIRGTRRFADEA